MTAEDRYQKQELAEIERYQYRTVHSPIIILAEDPAAFSAMSVHGPIIVTRTKEEAKELIAAWADAQTKIRAAIRESS